MQKQIQKLLNTSKKVFQDCAQSNGAIVAANSRKKYAPPAAKNYFFVWPRDAYFVCRAAKKVGLELQPKFFDWCLRNTDFQKFGLFREKYFTNGKPKFTHFQLDQTASVLLNLHDFFGGKMPRDSKYRPLVANCADTLARLWTGKNFAVVNEDLWEERLCFPDLEENFAYTLAAVSRGLNCANELIPRKKWIQAAAKMQKKLVTKFPKNYFRSAGKLNDTRVDASLLGLVFPSEVADARDAKIRRTVELIEEKLVKNGGVHRYENDKYDGWMWEKTTHRQKGAGYWPLLNFWLAIYFVEAGDRKKALLYYKKVLRDLGDASFIPEQIFENKIQVGISPLAWSHAMFVLASQKLGFC